MSTFVIWLLLAPIVVLLGCSVSWIYKPNNPFWVYRKLKELKVGEEWWAKGSGDRLPREHPAYSPHHRTAIVQGVKCRFVGGKVYYKSYIDGVPVKPSEDTAELSARSFFDFFCEDEKPIP